MAREVFVDSGAWIAIVIERDQWHQLAVRQYRDIARESTHLVTTNLVIAESYIMVRLGGGHAAAMRFLESVRSSPRVEVVRSDGGIESEAESILGRFSDQTFSFTDAVSFSLMRSRQIIEAFTFHRHFVIAGFQAIPALSK